MHNRAIVVVTNASAEEVQAYLYDHTQIVGQVFIAGIHRRHLLLETTGDTEERAAYYARYQSERLQSGLHGAAVYNDLVTAACLHKEHTGVDLSQFLPKKELIFRFDVSGLNDDQIDALKAEVCAQAEESIEHYTVPVSFDIESAVS